MKCDECKEQVFELIERERGDPDGVRAILERCPDCRAAFEETKAALSLAEQLPIEEPPAVLDAAILRAAGEREGRVVPLRKRRVQPPPWAMAAIALLAVGVGVWTIPREVQYEGDTAPAEVESADAKTVERAIVAEEIAEEAPHDEAKLDDGWAAPEANEPVQAPRGEVGGAKEKKASPEPPRRKRQARSSGREASAGAAAVAPATLPVADAAEQGAAESRSFEVAAKASAPSKQERDDDATSACQRKVDDLERRARAAKGHEPTPQEELEIGECYRALDNVAEARKWLQRAAAHRRTKAAAEKALRELGPE